MKLTTINFWTGVFLGASFTILIPEWYAKYKKKLEVKNDNSKSDVDSWGISDQDGSESDSSSLSDEKIHKLYETLANEYKTITSKDIGVVDVDPWFRVPVPNISCDEPNKTITISDNSGSITLGEDYISDGSIRLRETDNELIIEPVPLDATKIEAGKIDQSILYGNYPTCDTSNDQS